MSLQVETLTVDPSGFPVKSEEAKAKGFKKGAIMPFAFIIIFTAIGYGIAALIYANGSTEKYDAKIMLVAAYEAEWAYLAAFIFSILTVALNFFSNPFKSRLAIPPNNMFVYKLADGNSKSAVILDLDGDIGKYNRGNRSLYHFLENSHPMLLGLIMNSYVFPFPTFITVVCYSVGRILYSLGLTLKGFGAHVPGFMIDRFCTFINIGFFLIIALKAM